jgi:two-component system nitrate/nitrite response regulator NarL
MGREDRIRLALVDDHPIVLDGLERLFALESDFEIVARCREGEAATRELLATRPDLVILDLRLPGRDGLAVLASLREARLSTRVLLLTAAIDGSEVVEALRLGASGLVLKEIAPEVVVQAARRIHAGGQWFEPGVMARAMEEVARRGAGAEASVGMTPREREIVARVARGLRNRAIAEELGISEGTVKLHLHHVYEKLNLSGRMDLLLWVQKRGL